MSELSNPQIRKLKALAQHLEPALKVGKHGLTDSFIQSLGAALTKHELVKIKFVDFKEEKKELSAALAEKTGSRAIMRVGHVVVLYRQNPEPEKQVIKF
jgi:RNA-binding protein